MAVRNPSALQVSMPGYRMDQIVDIVEGDFTVGPGVDDGFGNITATTVSTQFDQLSGKKYYLRGLWSYDFGVSWQELNMAVVVGTAANGLRTISVNATSSESTKLTVYGFNSGNVAYAIRFKILLMARADQEEIGSTALNQDLRYNTNNNYMKIFKEGSVQLPTAGNTTIDHNLNKIPSVMAWLKVDEAGGDSYFTVAPSGGVYATTTQLVTTLKSFAGSDTYTLYYRIYIDG